VLTRHRPPSRYEPPVAAEITIGALGEAKDACVAQVVQYLEDHGIVPGLLPEVVELFVADDFKTEVAAEAATLVQLPMSEVSMQWLQVLAEGWASPLKGFMREKEFLQALHFNAISRHNQSVPIVLPCTAEQKAAIEGKDAITLCYGGKAVAILRAPEVYNGIKEERCSRTFGLNHEGHPYVVFHPRTHTVHPSSARVARALQLQSSLTL
jgi:3'-phosphoadenosine 5'-phosphosulfate synthase